MRFGGLKRLAIFSFNDTATTEIYALSLHDARPIYFQGKFTTETQRARRFLLGYPRTRSPVVRALRGSSRCSSSILKPLLQTPAESPYPHILSTNLLLPCRSWSSLCLCGEIFFLRDLVACASAG